MTAKRRDERTLPKGVEIVAGLHGIDPLSLTEEMKKAPPIAALTPAQIDAMRVAKGVCRHCGGPVPCHSEFGDQRVGVRHSTRSWTAMRKREETA